MRDLVLGKHKLTIYDSIEELPIVRHHKFSKLVLIDANIGSELVDFDSHMERVIRYIRSKKVDLAEKELFNLRQNVFFIQSEVSPKHLAFAALVKKLDGKEITDVSDESLKKIAESLSDATVKEVEEALEASKKKLDLELQTYFPKLFDSSSIKEYYDKLKRRTLLLIKKIETELTSKEEDELEALTNELVLFSEPQSFSGPESFEIQQDKQFENACLLISQHTHTDPKKFTVLEYFNAIFFIQEQNKTPGIKKSRK